MRKALVMILVILLLASLTACLGVKSDTSDCGYSEYDGICTDTSKANAQATLSEYIREMTATAEGE